MTDHSRRNFLKQTTRASSAAALGIGLPGILSSIPVMAAPDDYKALVYIVLDGGNDSFNMLAP